MFGGDGVGIEAGMEWGKGVWSASEPGGQVNKLYAVHETGLESSLGRCEVAHGET